MKQSLFFLFAILLTACSVDNVVPCGDNPALSGLACSELIETERITAGSIEYSYGGQRDLVRKDFIDPDGNIEREIRFSFKDGKLLTQREQINGSEKVIAYSYNEQDSVTSKGYFTGATLDSIAFCDFENGKRVRNRIVENDVLLRFDEYRYRQSDDVLNRISFYSADSVLQNYLQFEFFGNGKERVDLKTKNHILIYRDVKEFSTSGALTKLTRTSSSGETILIKEFEYTATGSIKKEISTGLTETRTHTFYYY